MAKLIRFYRDRRSRWTRLDGLLAEYDSGLAFTGGKADELYRLYRLVSGDLAFMQSHTGNPALLDYLEDLVGRAHARLTPPSRPNLLKSLFHTLRWDFPAAVAREKGLVAMVVAVFVAGAVFGGVLSLVHTEAAETFLSAFPNLLEKSPVEDAASRGAGVSSVGAYLEFSLYLFTHNVRVAITSFALGLTFGVGTAVIVFYNGAIIGSVAALYARDGVFLFFLSWVGPHGALELPAILLAASAGFALARAQLSGGGSVLAALRAAKGDCLALMAGSAFLLAVAGMIEGGFSQIHDESITALKIAVAAVCFAGLLAWLFVLPRAQR